MTESTRGHSGERHVHYHYVTSTPPLHCIVYLQQVGYNVETYPS